MKKLAIISSHPIQYNAPLFRLLHQRNKIDIKVFYTWGQTALEDKFDPGFNKKIEWDIPLLTGYKYVFVNNTAKQPGSHHFNGIINPTLIKEIETFEADAIFVYGWNFNSHLKALRYFHKRVPVFFRGDSTLMNDQPFYKKFARKILLKFIYRHVDFAFYVGSENRKYFKEYGLKDNQLILSGHAIDMQRFSTNNFEIVEKAKQWKQNITHSKNAIVFLFAGKFEKIKNLSLLITCFNTLKKEDVHLIIAGSGLLQKELMKMAEENNNIHFLPFQNQSEMPALYHIADIFVLPSLSETWGLSINEAMACGKAILISDKCGCATDLVKENINGFIFKNNNEIDLLEQMNKIIFNKQKLEIMGKQSSDIIEQYSFENICLALENTLIIQKNN